MPRTIQITVPPEGTEDILVELRSLQPLSIQLYRGVSQQPPGDLIAVTVTNTQLSDLMQVADRHGLGQEGGVSMTTSVPLSVVSDSFAAVASEGGATTWEEVEQVLGEESTMSADKVLTMLLAGIIAGVGIITGSVHIVVGAMVIAPGFHPFARVMLGIVTGTREAWRGGVRDVLRGYAAMLAGAALAALLGAAFGESALQAGGFSYLGSDLLVRYWTTTSWSGVAVGAAASLAGGLLLSINRTVLTAGVMVALALVPSASLVSAALVAGDLGLSGRALLRFSVDVMLVLAGCALVFLVKRRTDTRLLAAS